MRYSVSIRCLVVLLAVFALVACSQTKTRASGTAPSDGFRAPSQEFVWDIAARVLREAGMEPSTEESSKQCWTIVTHWRHEMAPFSQEGFRQRATVKILEVPGQCESYFYTETQVVRQINDNQCAPSNVMVASWGDEARCGELECIINRRIEMYFLPGGISTQFRQRYGIDDVAPDRDCIRCDEIDRSPVVEQEPRELPPQPVGTMGR